MKLVRFLALLPALLVLGCGSSGDRARTEETGSPAATRTTPKACPPPGPAVVLESGRTLCGEAARRYVRSQRQAQKFAQGPPASAQEEARRILATDPVLRPLLRGHRTRVAALGRWDAEDGHSLGVFADIESKTPIAATATLPYTCSDSAPAIAGRIRYRLRDLTRLYVSVDVAHGRVADVKFGTPVHGPTVKVLAAKALPGSIRCRPSRD